MRDDGKCKERESPIMWSINFVVVRPRWVRTEAARCSVLSGVCVRCVCERHQRADSGGDQPRFRALRRVWGGGGVR